MTDPLHAIDPAAEVARIRPQEHRAVALLLELEAKLQEVGATASSVLVFGRGSTRDALNGVNADLPAMLALLRAAVGLLRQA